MKIAYHLGVHCTDDDRLVRTLRRNSGVLLQQGIEVPDPARYHSLIRETAIQLNGHDVSPEVETQVLDRIMDGESVDRLVLSWDSFLAFASWAVRGRFYRNGGERMQVITRIFPASEAEFFIALRNPATFLPELHRRRRGREFTELTDGVDLYDLRWSDLIHDLLERNPQTRLTVWADEETPLIWPQILRAVAACSPGTELEGEGDLIASVMSDDGIRRMEAYLSENPAQNPVQYRRVAAAFLDKFAKPGALDYAFELAGWTPDLAARLSENYENDLRLISRMPGVTWIGL